MFPAQLYVVYYNYSMLLIVLLTALIYAQGNERRQLGAGFNSFMIWAVGASFILFFGTRPIDGKFVDMVTYSQAFQISQNTGISLYPDWGFNFFTDVCAAIMNVETFFLVCAAIYVAPLAVAVKRAHKDWAFPVLIALMTAFSFFSYGTNGIRNGISTSLLIAAFAFSDRKLVMILLMVAAESMHKSALLPIAAFLVTGLYAQPWVYGTIWTSALVITLIGKEALAYFFVGFVTFGDDERLSSYAANAGFGADKGGFRLDFLLYSITPVIISYALANPTSKKDPFYRRILCTYLLTNAGWIILMYAAFSNRFAYLSWFLMPWVIFYPLIPTDKRVVSHGQQYSQPGTALLGIALIAHFAFTFLMMLFIYPGRS